MMLADTLPRLLYRNAASMGAQPALREKRHGIWQTLSWSAYEALVLAIARGLAARGFGAGDRIAVIGDNKPRLYAAMLAAQSLGGVGVPLWPDAEPNALADMLAAARVRAVIAEDQEQLAKLVAAKEKLPDLRLVVSLDPRAARGDDTGWLIDLAMLQQQGSASSASLGRISDGHAGDAAVLLLRSGQPGVVLSHANLLSAARTITEVEDVRATDEAVCFMPMAWIGDVLYSLALSLLVGFTCNCPESPETAHRDLREIGPHLLAAPPAVWESWLRNAEDRATHATRLKRVTFAWARRVAEAAEHRREAGKSGGGVAHKLADGLVFSALRDQLGLARLRWAHTGGTPVAPEIWRLYRSFGVNLKQSYGPAELAGLATVHRTDPVSADTVGYPAPGIEIRIAGDGEVQARGDNVCLGYDGDAAARIGAEAWWRTGDAGEFDATGRLIIHDRLADMGRMADGTSFVPSAVEAHLRRSRFIADTLAFGNSRPFVAAIIAPDHAALAEWAEHHRLSGTSLADFVALPETRALIREELRTCNAGLPPALQVRRFLLLNQPLEAEDIESRLYRERFRRLATVRHAALIDALFRGSARSTEVPAEPAATPATQALVEDVDDTMLPVLEPAHA